MEPSARDTTWGYRWRGREQDENIIEVGADHCIYTMTFSRGGNAVPGTWGMPDHEVTAFTGRRVDNGYGVSGMDIKAEWDSLSPAAHGMDIKAEGDSLSPATHGKENSRRNGPRR